MPTTASLDFDDDAKEELLDYYGLPDPMVNGNPAQEATSNPYSEKRFEASPFSRILETGAPGDDWAVRPASDADHTIKYAYTLNTAVGSSDKVKLYKAGTSWNSTYNYYNISLTNSAGTTFYDPDELTVSVLKDENWTSGKNNTVEEYRNVEGQVVLKRAFNGSGETPHDTYYVYDTYGNLTYVIPPGVNGSVSSTDLAGLCYQYRYDDRNRLVEKKLPGKRWEYIVYDALDRVVAAGPTKSPFSDLDDLGWLITKYDAFNRPVLTAWMESGSTVDSGDRMTLQAGRDAQTTNLYEKKSSSDTILNGIAFRYTTLAWPTSSYHILTVTYYDNYNYTLAPTDFTTEIEGQKVCYNNTTRKPKGLVTGLWVRALEGNHDANFEFTKILYDAFARPIRTVKHNYLRGQLTTDTKLTFSGRVDRTVRNQRRLGTDDELIITDRFSYTKQDRLFRHTHQINNNDETLLAQNTYDELGKLVNRRSGGVDTTAVTYWQKVDYAYTIRGWLKAINDITDFEDGDRDDLFAYKLNYTTTEGTATDSIAGLFNGNISETYWRSAADNQLRKYGYRYDAMNRLEKAVYQRPESFPADIWDSYNEEITYDRNGNIKRMQRTGLLESDTFDVDIDDLDYEYFTDSNQLKRVTDKEGSVYGFKDDWADPNDDTDDDYTYDDFGNMTSDQNKHIPSESPIRYNHLNLPTVITVASNGPDRITYVYNALGQKVKKTVVMYEGEHMTPVVTDYLDGFQYVDEELQFFPTAQGYVRVVDNRHYYIFSYSDQVGNVRMNYGRDPENSEALVILEENHYYPYGLKHQNYNIYKLEYVPEEGGIILASVSAMKNKYSYNCMEWQEELGYNMYDMPFRDYDPAIGRWVIIDPIIHFAQSPYNGYNSNPVYWSDPLGAKGSKPKENFDVDMFGREKFDRFGLFIPPQDRTSKREYNFIDVMDGGNGYGNGYVMEIDGKMVEGTWVRFWIRNDAPGLGPDDNPYDYNLPDFVLVPEFGYKFVPYDGLSNIMMDINAAGVGNDIKNGLFTLAGKSSELSPAVARYLKVTKGLGTIGAIVTTGYSISKVNDQWNEGGWSEVFEHRDVLDASIGTFGLGTSALVAAGLVSNPVGWIVGGAILVYGVGTLIYDAYNEN